MSMQLRTTLSFSLVAVLALIGCSAEASIFTSRAAQRRAARSAAPAPIAVNHQAAPTQKVTRLPILVYHHIRENEGWPKESWSAKMSISPKGFERQMQWLVDRGYTTVSMDDAAAMLKGDIGGPAKPVVITFDDNNMSGYDLGLPVLKKHGLTATFYIVTDRLGNKNTTHREILKSMVASGMDIQSHTVTHRALTGLGQKDIDWELTESKKALEELIGKPVRHVAYPGTAHNQTVRDRTKAMGYVTGTIMDPRAAVPTDDLMKLPRIMMIDDTNLQKMLP
jgi:peptidoglycan/xylan/chitin deacetylase (PgdA/CDA1 family)